MIRFAVPFLLLLGACASVTTGTTQTIAIESEPPGAACALERAGDVIARVTRTPGEVTVTRTSIPIEVDCSLENHLPGRTTVPSGIQAMTFGNVLIGGVIGVVVDAASGAIHSYPERARVDLSPESFANAEARDAYFEARRARLQAALTAVQSRYEQECAGGDRGPNAARCADEMESVLAQAERALERVETERLAARIAPGGAKTARAQSPQAQQAPGAPGAPEAAKAAPAAPPASEEEAEIRPPPPLTDAARAPTPAPQAAPQPAPQPALPPARAAAAPATTPAPAAEVRQAAAPAAVGPPEERWRLRMTVKTPIVTRSWCRPNESGTAEFAVVDGRSTFKLRSDSYGIATVTARLDDPDGPALRILFRGQSSPRPFSVRLPQPAAAGQTVERTILYTHSYTPCEYTIALERMASPTPEAIATAAPDEGPETPESVEAAGSAAAPSAPETPDVVAAYEARLADLEAMLSEMRAELTRIKAADGRAPDETDALSQ